MRTYEKLTLSQLKEVDETYEKWLRDQVFMKHRDKEGFYVSATGDFKSKVRSHFQVDHILSMHNGGLTVLENLQLLTRRENAKKGNKD